MAHEATARQPSLEKRRIVKRVYSTRSGGDSAYTRFIYHGDHVAFETDSSGTAGRRYTWGLGTDDLIGVREAGGTQYYAVKDKLGSVRGLIKRDGTWMFSERFGPYGVRAEFSGDSTIVLRYRWTGREYDAETGMYYFRARYYDATARRFVQEDPIGYAGSSNLYAYVDGNVLEARDPSGLRGSTPAFSGWCLNGSCISYSGELIQDAPVDPMGGGGGAGIHGAAFGNATDDNAAENTFMDQFASRIVVTVTYGNNNEESFSLNASDPIFRVLPVLQRMFAEAPSDPSHPGYKLEVGGWCDAKGCSSMVGSFWNVSLGPQLPNTILGWHTHPNVGLPAISPESSMYMMGSPDGLKAVGQLIYAPWPSGIPTETSGLDGDMSAAFNNNYTVPMYVLSSGGSVIYRYGASLTRIYSTRVR